MIQTPLFWQIFTANKKMQKCKMFFKSATARAARQNFSRMQNSADCDFKDFAFKKANFAKGSFKHSGSGDFKANFTALKRQMSDKIG